MPEVQCVMGDGTPVPMNERVQTDNFVITYRVTVRAGHCVSADTIKALIQRKFEVVGAEETGKVVVCRPCR